MKLNPLDNFFLRLFERKKKNNSILEKIIFHLFWKRYKRFFFECDNRSELARAFWGREGGFKHAVSQFNRSIDLWSAHYGQFCSLVSDQLTCDSSILEIGCSAGQWPKRLNLESVGCKYFGIDINPLSIDFANEHFHDNEKICFKRMNIDKLGSTDDFNIIISCQTLFFLSQKECNNFLKKVKKTGTLVVLQEPVNPDFESFVESKILKDTAQKTVGFSHNYLRIMEDAGFSLISKKLINFDKNDILPKLLAIWSKAS
jgi:SAM-dependent methyltransferase